MSASHDAPTDAPAEIHPHPPMPAVHDEAADSPTWLPVTGLAILLVMVLFVMLRAAMSPPVPETDATAEAAVEAPAPAAAAE
jgi:hypothetical protein